MGETAWQRQYQLTLALHDLGAELASLCGQFEEMEQLITTVMTQAQSLLAKVNVYRIRIQFQISQNQPLNAIAIARTIFQEFRITFPDTPTNEDIQDSITEVNNLIGDRQIADLINLPCYAKWGAKAKTEQLETTYPQLLKPILQQRRIPLNPWETIATLAFPRTSSSKHQWKIITPKSQYGTTLRLYEDCGFSTQCK